jgi:hypothetical protein
MPYAIPHPNKSAAAALEAARGTPMIDNVLGRIPVKFTGDHVIAGDGIPFGGPFKMGTGDNGKDLHGEFFSKSTDCCLDWFTERPLLYEHGRGGAGVDVVGRVKSWSTGEKAINVEAELDASYKYFSAIKELVDKKKLFFSSGAMGHLVQTNVKTGEILRWPWVELSLTKEPANFHATLDWKTAGAHFKAAGLVLTDLEFDDRSEALKAVWSTAYKNELPDSSFAYIEAGGEKDGEGKTKPRSLRHFPYKDKDGKPDEAHVKDALGRIPQSDVSDSAKASALKLIKAAAKKLGIEVSDDSKKSITQRLINIKGMFEEEIQDQFEDIWFLFSTFCRVVNQIDQLEDATEGTAVSVNVEALLDEAIGEFAARLKPAAMAQINDEDDDDMYAYRSAPIEKFKALIDAKQGTAMVRLPLVDHSSAVMAANEELFDRVSAISEERLKAGRVLSQTNHGTLRKLHGQLTDATGKLGNLLDKTDPNKKDKPDDKPKDDPKSKDDRKDDGDMKDDAAKSADEDLLLRARAHIILGKQLAGDPATTEA